MYMYLYLYKYVPIYPYSSFFSVFSLGSLSLSRSLISLDESPIVRGALRFFFYFLYIFFFFYIPFFHII